MEKNNELTTIDLGEYREILQRAVAVIDDTRITIARQVNISVSSAYWELGKLLHERKLESTHGSSVVEKLSADLKERYPQMGFSPRNLWNMKSFYLRYCDSDAKLQQAVALLPWGHNLLLMNKKKNDAEVLFYANECITKGWNRELLLNAVKMDIYGNQPLIPADNNFGNTLPSVQSAYANEVFRSTYNLGFLGVTTPILELELERRLMSKITTFLLELGKGFCFIGNQHTLEFNGKESKVDMLFYHRGLKCLVAIDLKIGQFIPEYAGKMNYYLSLLDRLERGEGDNRSIGIILCAEKDHVEVELALEDMGKPIGVADYQLIVPKKQLEAILKDEMEAFDNEVLKYESNGE